MPRCIFIKPFLSIKWHIWQQIAMMDWCLIQCVVVWLTDKQLTSPNSEISQLTQVWWTIHRRHKHRMCIWQALLTVETRFNLNQTTWVYRPLLQMRSLTVPEVPIWFIYETTRSSVAQKECVSEYSMSRWTRCAFNWTVASHHASIWRSYPHFQAESAGWLSWMPLCYVIPENSGMPPR